MKSRSAPSLSAEKRLKYVADLNPASRQDLLEAPDTEVSFLPMEAIGEGGSLNLDETRPVSDVRNGYSYFENGDVAFAKVTPCFENGKGALMSGLEAGAGFGTTELTVLRARQGTSARFLHYVVQSSKFRQLGAAAMTGAGGLKRVPNEFTRDFKAFWPPLPEQTRIANFLDEQTARIDALIAEKERLDGLLGEYRSSLITATVTGHVDVETGAMFPRAHEGGGGVSGRVVAPVAWSWSKLKHVASFYTGWTPPTGNAEFFDGDNLWANISDLGPKILHDTAKRISEKAIDNTAMRVSPAGSVLFSFKLSIGQISFAGRDMYTNEAIATFPPQAGFNTRWAYWALPIFLPLNADENIYGAKLLNQELMRSADILVPPLADQERIANFLDEQTARIDALREHCKEHIGLLREYRAALISAAVTGQLDIDNFGRQVA